MSLITHVFTTTVPNKYHSQVKVSLENCRIDCVNIVIEEKADGGPGRTIMHFTLPELKKIYDLANTFNQTHKQVKEIL